MSFGAKLKRLRIDNRLTQKDLARMIGVQQTTVARYENNINFPSTFVLTTIAKILNTDISWLIFGENRGMLNEQNRSFLDEFKLPLNAENQSLKAVTQRAPRIIKEIAKQGRDTGKDTEIEDSEMPNKLDFLTKENLELKKIIADQNEKILELQNKLIELLEKDPK
ncbi:MAG: helix-turn-helix transcriptional regulator [Candidatus Cloacimonetes bacterium]|jgi:transcriptional regulator with XRE-family HTH domain|nr:helix-turn-helix transcriptional regulator [Candidatus Cloacimonadota bacterium]